MVINFNNMLDVLKSSRNHNFKMGEILDFLKFKILDIGYSSLLFSQTIRLWNYKFNSLVVLWFKKEIFLMRKFCKNIWETVLYRHYLNSDI